MVSGHAQTRPQYVLLRSTSNRNSCKFRFRTRDTARTRQEIWSRCGHYRTDTSGTRTVPSSKPFRFMPWQWHSSYKYLREPQIHISDDRWYSILRTIITCHTYYLLWSEVLFILPRTPYDLGQIVSIKYLGSTSSILSPGSISWICLYFVLCTIQYLSRISTT